MFPHLLTKFRLRSFFGMRHQDIQQSPDFCGIYGSWEVYGSGRTSGLYSNLSGSSSGFAIHYLFSLKQASQSLCVSQYFYQQNGSNKSTCLIRLS